MSAARSRRLRTGRLFLPVALLVVVLLATTACSGGTDEVNSSETVTTTAAPAPTAPSTAIPSLPASPTTGPVLVSPFLLHEGWISKGAAQQMESVDGVTAALDALLAGPTEVDTAAGLSTAVPTNARLRSLTVDGDIATVDFNRAFETRDTQPQTAQVVFTLTQVDGIAAVQFLIDGEPNGATGVKPLNRANFKRYTPTVVVETPTPGQTVTGSVAVSGTASTPATTVTYRLEDPAGQVLAEGSFVRGDDGTGQGPFAGTIDVAGYTGQAVLVTPAPDPALDDASLARVPFALG